MENKIVWSKLIYLMVALCFVAFMAISGSAEGAPAPTQSSGPRYGGTMRLSDVSDGASIGYPPKLLTTGGMRHVAPAIETLFRVDKAGKPVPWLATGLKEDAKAKAILLTLRKGVQFHDGTDFNAEAVKWNLDQCMAARQMGAEKFKSIDMVDDYTVRINLTEWDTTVTSNLAAQPLGMMISPTAYKKNGEDWCAKNPIGTGPFQFVSWEKDVRTIYKKFPNYWQKGKPYLDSIVWTPIFDSVTRQLSFRAGELDLAVTLAAKDVASLEKDGYLVFRGKVGSGAISIIPDSANPKSSLADLRVRQAIQHAIDNEALVQSVFSGEAEPANQWIYKGHWGYNPSVVGYPYNPAKAKQLLSEAGYPNGFKTKIIYRANPQEDQLFTAVQGYLKTIGIDAELDPAQKARYDQISVQGGKWEGLLMNALSPNPDVAAALAARYSGGGKFFSQMLIPDDYAKAIQNAVTAPDFETKQKWTQEVMKVMIDKHALQIVLLCRKDFAVSQPYLHNHGFNETPANALWTPGDAWLER